MTTPQPQPMKRYEPYQRFVVGDRPHSEVDMRECDTGDYIRHDDPALVAAREAMEEEASLMVCISPVCQSYGPGKCPVCNRHARFRLALDGLKGNQ